MYAQIVKLSQCSWLIGHLLWTDCTCSHHFHVSKPQPVIYTIRTWDLLELRGLDEVTKVGLVTKCAPSLEEPLELLPLLPLSGM